MAALGAAGFVHLQKQMVQDSSCGEGQLQDLRKLQQEASSFPCWQRLLGSRHSSGGKQEKRRGKINAQLCTRRPKVGPPPLAHKAMAGDQPLKDLIDGEAKTLSDGAGQASQPTQHFWEEEVQPCQVSQTVKDHCKYGGLPVGHIGRLPLLLAVVSGVDESGVAFVWIARRARKRVLQPHQCAVPPPPISWLSSLSFSRQWLKPGWWIAALFALGSVLFLMTGIAREWEAVSHPATWPPGVGSKAAWLSAWPEVIACYTMYFPAVIIQVLEASNMDYECRWVAWEKGGCAGRPPRPRLLPTRAHLRTVSWWLAVLQVAGMLGFNMAVTADLVNYSRGIADHLVKWLQLFGFLMGGALFTVFFALQGSLGFFIFGLAFFAAKFSWAGEQALIAYGQIFASACFLLSAVAGLLEQGNPGHL
ncbi:hypothetical protein N2152v2_003394 [Parachlorella kessleri]